VADEDVLPTKTYCSREYRWLAVARFTSFEVLTTMGNEP
jgi:hypothetical protein